MRLVVDLTPVLPGGQNGGLKPLVLSLLHDLIVAAPNVEFIVLTSSITHTELASLDAPNARRLCVARAVQGPAAAPAPKQDRVSFQRRVRFAMTRVLPPRLMLWIELAYLASTGKQPKHATMLRELGADVLFSPFLSLSFYEPGVPSVSLVHNLQIDQYPRFFRPQQRAAHHRELQRVLRLSDRVVCTSAFVYGQVLKNSQAPSARIVTIPPRAIDRLAPVDDQELGEVLARLDLSLDEFLLYPGTFLPHKNHGMLLAAFGVFLARNPASMLKLVCPGEQGAAFDELVYTTRAMGLEGRVLFPGFVSETRLAALYQACRAVIVPSLYAGLSLAVLEAVAFSRPLVCAHHASFQDGAGEAAVYFDPALLADVVQAIERAAHGPTPQRIGRVPEPDPPSGQSTGAASDLLRLFSEVAA